MKTSVAKLGKAGRLVIPVEFRRELGLEDGGAVTLRFDEKGLHISTPRQALSRAQAYVQSLDVADRDLAAELISERRRETSEELR